MNFMLLSKENLGCAILLLLVIVLSLAKIFNVFIDTPLARIVLLLFVLFISYLNKILGVVSVLFIIIILNGIGSGTNYLYQEGFDTNTMLKEESSKVTSKEKEVQKGDNSVDITTKINDTINAPTLSTKKNNAEKDKINDSSNTSEITSSIATSTATEGFDIIGLENDIKRGKQSNSIPVNSFMKESSFISAFESNPFSNNFMDFFGN
jgi:hypothetical protein